MEESRILIGLDFSVASKEVIEILIDDASDPNLFQEIARANTNRPDILQLLQTHPDTPEDVRSSLSTLLHLPAPVSSSTEAARPGRSREIRTQSILQKIQTLSVSEKLQLAMKGGREIRGILIKDTNKEVMLGVLDNQKITDTEVEMIARSRSINDEALRKIAKNREWLKNYAIVFALVTNPKTPPGISVGLVGNLKTKDLVILEKNKNVPDVVRSAGKRLLSMRKPK
jgi:ribosome maturation factor RimP